MSAQRTADAAITIAEDALRRIRNIETGDSHLLITMGVVLSLAFLYYVQNAVGQKDTLEPLQQLLTHKWIRSGTFTVIIIGLAGIFGRSFQIFAQIIGFTLLLSLILLPPSPSSFSTKKEGYASLPISVAEPTCGKVPQAYRPNAPLLGISDALPPTGVDMLSSPPGVYTDSGIAYEMNMA